MSTILSDLFAPAVSETAPFPLEGHSVAGHRWDQVQGTGQARLIGDGTLASAPGSGLSVYALDGFAPSGAYKVSLGVRMSAPSDYAGPAAGISPDGKFAIVGYYDLMTGYPTLAVVHGGAIVASARCPKPWVAAHMDRLSIAVDPVAGTATLSLNDDPTQTATLTTALASAEGGRIGLYMLKVSGSYANPVHLWDLEVSGISQDAAPVDPPEPVGAPAFGTLLTTVYQVVAHGPDAATREALALAAGYGSLAKWQEVWSTVSTVPYGGTLVAPATLATQLAAHPATAVSLDWETGYVRETDGGVPSIGDPTEDGQLLYVSERTYFPAPTNDLAASIVAEVYGLGRPLSFAESAQLLSGGTQGFADVSGIAISPLPVEFMTAVAQTIPRKVTFAPPSFLTAPPYDAALST